MMRGADYNLARMSGMLDLSRDEKARVGRLRPRRRAVNRAAVRPDGYHVGKLAFRRKVAGNVLVIHDSLFHQHLSERQGTNFRTASSLNVCSAVETSPRAAELQRNSNDPEGRSGDKAAWQNFCRENFAMSVLDFGIIRA